jgi:hypothetical protein
VNGNYQILDLIKYSKKLNGIPLYLFYNYCKESKELNHLRSMFDYDLETLGCAISKTEGIYSKYFRNSKLKSIGFYDLIHENLYPLSYLSENILNLLNIHDKNLKYHSKSEILNNENWKDLFPKIDLGYANPINLNTTKLQEEKDNTSSFNPMFRIIISKEANNLELPIYRMG